MTTTSPLSAVAGVEQIAEELVDRLLEPRETVLNHRAPRVGHQLRRDIRAGKARPMHMLLTVLFADLDDNVPVEIVLRTVDELRAVVVTRGRREPSTCAKTLGRLLMAECRAEAEKNLAEIALHDDPHSPALRKRYLDAAAKYDVANGELTRAVQHNQVAIEQQYPQTARPLRVAETRAVRRAAVLA